MRRVISTAAVIAVAAFAGVERISYAPVSAQDRVAGIVFQLGERGRFIQTRRDIRVGSWRGQALFLALPN